MKKHNILLSTDIGTDIDDALALYFCINSPEINVKGIYVTNGNVVMRAKIARKILRLTRYNAPVCIGEANPLPPANVPPYHNQFERVLLSKKEYDETLETAKIKINGLSHLEQMVDETNTNIISIAPLTNIALAIQRNPSFHKKLEKVYIIGGRENELEHNFRHDISAAQIVFDSSLPIVVVPANVCDKFKINSSYLTQLRGTPLNKYLSHMANVWKTSKEIQSLMNGGIKDLPMPLLPTLEDIEHSNPSFRLPDNLKRTIQHLSNYKAFSQDYQKMFDFYKMFKESIKHLESQGLKYIINMFFEKIEKREFSISDTYAIYTLLHPDKTERKKAKIKVDDNGCMSVLPGSEHEIITDIDYGHFKEFIIGNLK